jgi:hypothetical protein
MLDRAFDHMVMRAKADKIPLRSAAMAAAVENLCPPRPRGN